MAVATAAEVLAFWFEEIDASCWFQCSPAFDDQVRERFLETWQVASRGELADWEATAAGACALVIVLDQFPLNMFRNQPESFSTEAASRAVAARAIAHGFDAGLTPQQKAFLYIPYMHSEDPGDQDRSVELYRAAGLNENLKYAEHHRDIVRRFGRFPHRNAILERESTRAELDYLASDEGFHG